MLRGFLTIMDGNKCVVDVGAIIHKAIAYTTDASQLVLGVGIYGHVAIKFLQDSLLLLG
jgi:hypothetical protein